MPTRPIRAPTSGGDLTRHSGVDDPGLRPDRWTIRTVLDRVREAGDPLAELIGRPQRLPAL